MRAGTSRKMLVRATCLTALIALAACDSPEERLASHYESGRALVEEGSDSKALLEFRNALRIDGDHAPSRFEIGKIREERGNIRAAVTAYRAVAEASPDHVEARWRLGRILTLGGALDEAREVIEEVVALAPEDPDVLATEAQLALRLGNADEARAGALAAIDRDPDHLAANVVLISDYVQREERDAALAHVDALLDGGVEEPDRRSLHLIRANLLATAGEADAVAAQLRRMIELYPEETDFRTALARLLIESGDLDGAEAEFRAIAAAAEADDVEPIMNVVRFVQQSRGTDAANAELDAQIEAAGEGPRAGALRLASAELRIQTGDEDGARALLEAMAGSDDRDSAASAKILLARLALRADRPDEASALVEEVLEEDEENTDALALRAALAIQDYRPADAIADLRRAREGDPDNHRLMLLEATAHERAGSRSLSGERLAAATRASGYAPEVSFAYADFLSSAGELTSAESILSETARRHPSDRAVLARLAETRLRLGDWSGAEQAAAALEDLEGGGGAAGRIIAASLSGQGRFDESNAVLEQLSDATGDVGSTMANLVVNYLRAGDRDRAVAFLDEVIAESPANARALLLRADLDAQIGDIEAALTRVDAVIAAEPDAAIGYLARSRLLLASGRAGEALDTALEGAARVERPEPLDLIAAQIYESEARFDDAIDVYTRLYDGNPESVLYANNLVSLLAEHHADDPESMAFAKRVAQRLRGYEIPHLQDTYGWVMFLNGDYTAALRSLEAAAAGLPNNPLVRYHIGRAYAELGQDDLARSHLEASLELDEAFPKARSARDVLAELADAGTE